MNVNIIYVVGIERLSNNLFELIRVQLEMEFHQIKFNRSMVSVYLKLVMQVTSPITFIEVQFVLKIVRQYRFSSFSQVSFEFHLSNVGSTSVQETARCLESRQFDSGATFTMYENVFLFSLSL